MPGTRDCEAVTRQAPVGMDFFFQVEKTMNGLKFRSSSTSRKNQRPGSARKRVAALTLEALEQRLCLATNPYVFVTSYANDSVMRYDESTGDPAPADGQQGAFFVHPQTCGLSVPLGIILTPDGDIVVSGGEDNRVIRFDGNDGTCRGDLVDQGSGGLSIPTGMIFSPDHSFFYVLSNFNNRVIRYDYDGQSGSNPIQLVSGSELGGPAGIVFGPDGYLYISSLNNNDVLRYDPITGAPVPAPGQAGALFVSPGSGGLSRPGGVVFGPDGNVYVASQNTDSIMRYDGTTGDPLPADGQDGATFVPSGSGGMTRPAGLVFGPGADTDLRDIYVVSSNTDNILRFDGTTGDFVAEFISAGSGGLSRPRSMSFGNTDPSTLEYISPGGSPRPGGHEFSRPLGTIHALIPGSDLVHSVPANQSIVVSTSTQTGALANTKTGLAPDSIPEIGRAKATWSYSGRSGITKADSAPDWLNASLLDLLAGNLLENQ